MLYHGTQAPIQYPIHPMGRILSIGEQKIMNRGLKKWKRFEIKEGKRFGEAKTKKDSDFGQGFYLSESKAFAAMRACGAGSEKAFLYGYTLKLNDNVKIFEFEKPNLQWVLFVAYNRGILSSESDPILYAEIDDFASRYDIITGPTANDKSYRFLKDFMTDPADETFIINFSQLQYVLEKTALPKQYVLLTSNACQCISEEYRHVFQGEELKNVFDLSRTRSNNAEKESKRLALGVRTLQGYSFTGILSAIAKNGYGFSDLPDNIPYEEYIEKEALENYVVPDYESEEFDNDLEDQNLGQEGYNYDDNFSR